MKPQVFVFFLFLFSRPLALGDSLDRLLNSQSLNKKDISFNQLDMSIFGGEKYAPPLFYNLLLQPLKAPSYAHIQKKVIVGKSTELTHMVIQSFARIQYGVRRNLVGDPLNQFKKNLELKNPLLPAVKKIYMQTGKRLTQNQIQKLKNNSKKLPIQVKQWLAFLIEASLYARKQQKKAFNGTHKDFQSIEKFLLKMASYQKGIGSGLPKELRKFASGYKLNPLSVGATDLAMAIEHLKKQIIESKIDKTIQFQIDTPIGKIGFYSGKEDNSHSGDFLILIDLAGNDTYLNVGGTSFKKPVSLIFDYLGNDNYVSHKELKNQSIRKLKTRSYQKTSDASVAAGIFGYSFLIDVSGDDVYKAKSFSLGAGVFGVGVLWDLDGNDRYECYSFCQAASYFGVGILIDALGRDTYSGFSKHQAFAGTLGSSLLLDLGPEADRYLSYLRPLDFPSLVDPQVNSSFSQGFSLGTRADIIDNHSWAGGIAVLYDLGGHNSFKAGFFTQGFSYWYGAGILLTGFGNDTYQAEKYAQGSAAHYGVGLLHDSGGHDSYSVSQELGLGVGHDFSLGVVVDLNGNDNYRANNLSLGSASANGIGIHLDYQGNDTYNLKGTTILGSAIDRVGRDSLRNRNPTIGIFLDMGGTNTVRAKNHKKSGTHKSKIWFENPAKVFPKEVRHRFYGFSGFFKKSSKTYPDGFPIF